MKIKLIQSSDKSFLSDIEKKLKKGFLKKPDNVKKILGSEVIQKTLHPDNLHLLTVCRSRNGNAELDVAILEALLNEKKGQKDSDDKISQEKFQSQLKLALKWNRIDIAKNYLFTDDNSDKVALIFKSNRMLTHYLQIF